MSKLDATTNIQYLYHAHPDYNGEEWYDWGLFHFTDSRRVPEKLNVGLILGFVQFDTPSFPSPGNIGNYTANKIHPGIIDKKFYVFCLMR